MGKTELNQYDQPMGRGKGTFGKSSIKRKGRSDVSQFGNAPLRARGKGTIGKSSIKRKGGTSASQFGNAPLRARDSSPPAASSSDILYGRLGAHGGDDLITDEEISNVILAVEAHHKRSRQFGMLGGMHASIIAQETGLRANRVVEILEQLEADKNVTSQINQNGDVLWSLVKVKLD